MESFTGLIASAAADNVASLGDLARTGLAAGADFVELRLDALIDPSPGAVRDLVGQLPAGRVILTCRPIDEGGGCDGTAMERVALLLGAGADGSVGMDFEFADWQRSANIRQKIGLALDDRNQRGTGRGRLILSTHFPTGRPESVERLVNDIETVEPDAIAKVAWFAHDPSDNLIALQLMRQRPGRRIVICMGPCGLMSRVLAGKCGAFAAYAAASDDSVTAPGQLTLNEMLNRYRWPRIGAQTRVYGVIGQPVGQSMGPALFNAAFELHGLDAVYLPLDVPADGVVFRRFVEGCAAREWLHLGGASVTHPHKANALALVGDRADANARRIGAVNTLAIRDGDVFGHNTDYMGIQRAVQTCYGAAPDNLRGVRVGILGAGGAARAATFAALDAGANVSVFARTAANAAWAAGLDRVHVHEWAQRTRKPVDLLIHCTTIGMHPNVDDSPVPAEALRPGTVVFDAVYHPRETCLLREARAAGRRTIDGLTMFVEQAAAQFELWTGCVPDRSTFGCIVSVVCGARASSRALDDRHIVLIGYRGSGKTRVGHLLATALARPFIDTDERIASSQRRSIADIFRNEGEPAFRAFESEVISSLADEPPSVVAVGGGALESAQNASTLQSIGRLIWLRARATVLRARLAADPSANRPALTPQGVLDEIESVLSRREASYRGAADCVIDTSDLTVEQTAQAVLAKI